MIHLTVNECSACITHSEINTVAIDHVGWWLTCDVIKPNESELANIDFLDRANNSIQFPLYCIVLSITIMTISLEPYAKF